MVSIRVRLSFLLRISSVLRSLCAARTVPIVQQTHGKMSENKQPYCCCLFEIETQGERIEAKRARAEDSQSTDIIKNIIFLPDDRSGRMCVCVLYAFFCAFVLTNVCLLGKE